VFATFIAHEPEAVGLLDTASGGGRLAGSLGGELLAGSLPGLPGQSRFGLSATPSRMGMGKTQYTHVNTQQEGTHVQNVVHTGSGTQGSHTLPPVDLRAVCLVLHIIRGYSLRRGVC